jgi:hypothetical protein
LAQDFYAIHNREIERLERKFSGYFPEIDSYSIREWLQQFENDADREVGIRLLGYVKYYKNSHITDEAKELYLHIQQLDQFNVNCSYFIGFGNAGHGSDIIVERFRYGNNLKGRRYEDRFRVLAELESLPVDLFTRLFFIDDFIGTGDNAIKVWTSVKRFLPKQTNTENLYLLVIAAHEEGKRAVETKTPLKVIPNNIVFENQKILSVNNTYFSTDQRKTIQKYCGRAATGTVKAQGYGCCQSNVVFHYRAPNNVISMLISNGEWKGLFMRNP